MAEPQFSMAHDDDLPRTIRREKDRQQRGAPIGGGYGNPPPAPGRAGTFDEAPRFADGGAAVTALRIPFFSLMAFLIKCVVAGIPALILLGAILYGLGQALKAALPWLVKMQIIVTFPN